MLRLPVFVGTGLSRNGRWARRSGVRARLDKKKRNKGGAVVVAAPSFSACGGVAVQGRNSASGAVPGGGNRRRSDKEHGCGTWRRQMNSVRVITWSIRPMASAGLRGSRKQEISGHELKLIIIKFEKEPHDPPSPGRQGRGLRAAQTLEPQDDGYRARHPQGPQPGQAGPCGAAAPRNTRPRSTPAIRSPSPRSCAILHRGADQPDQSYSERQDVPGRAPSAWCANSPRSRRSTRPRPHISWKNSSPRRNVAVRAHIRRARSTRLISEPPRPLDSGRPIRRPSAGR